ncbi:hypothetical protein VHEMI02191 [[Torrubiella] hemipterigena]|uniref:Uncharacterized protein n=1 Tax=[Torrubiella] hemipterigena TaxID=1531966 RepID=A0A0A1T757_9HYPO|nr:hypothetical protein VHEMI02191 [[Torrubiella] hemipterigena]
MMHNGPIIQVGPQRQYPPIRVSHSPGYASSTSSTLAESLPPSPVYYSPSHGDKYTEPFLHHSRNGSLKKKIKGEKRSWTSKPVVIKLLTSITVGVIVCLIVAAVVGKIRASNSNTTPVATTSPTPTAAAITLVDDTTSSPTSTTTLDSPSATSSISTSPSPTSIILPVGNKIASFNCPYVKEPRRRFTPQQIRAPSMRLCKLSTELSSSDKLPEASRVTVAKLDGCTIARGSYPGVSGQEMQYHCTVSCVGEVKGGTLSEGIFSCE